MSCCHTDVKGRCFQRAEPVLLLLPLLWHIYLQEWGWPGAREADPFWSGCAWSSPCCLQGCSTALPAERWGQSSSSLSWQQCCTLLSHSFKQYNVASGFLLHYCPRIRAMLQWIPLVRFVKCCLQPCSWPWLSDYMSSNISF